jgi:hypothetical protein
VVKPPALQERARLVHKHVHPFARAPTRQTNHAERRAHPRRRQAPRVAVGDDTRSPSWPAAPRHAPPSLEHSATSSSCSAVAAATTSPGEAVDGGRVDHRHASGRRRPSGSPPSGARRGAGPPPRFVKPLPGRGPRSALCRQAQGRGSRPARAPPARRGRCIAATQASGTALASIQRSVLGQEPLVEHLEAAGGAAQAEALAGREVGGHWGV